MTTKELQHEQLLPLAAILALALILATSNLLLPLTARTPTAHSATILDSPIEQQGSNIDATIIDLSFNPQCLCIEKGDTVNWTNNDPVIHTLWFVFADNKSTYLLSDPIPPGQSWAHTFTQPRKFTLLYYSFERLWITGTIRVYRILGDIDGDGDVDYGDFLAFAASYLKSSGQPGYDREADFDCDGDVDYDDFLTFAANYLKSDP